MSTVSSITTDGIPSLTLQKELWESAWDTDSEEDSLMPRRRTAEGDGTPMRRAKLREEDRLVSVFDWEMLDEESTCYPLPTEETASLTSYTPLGDGRDEFVSPDSGNASTASASVASMETIVTRSAWLDPDDPVVLRSADHGPAELESTKSADPFKPVASRAALQAIDEAKIGQKAVKADDAEVPVHLWDLRIIGPNAEESKVKAIGGFRQFGLRMFWKGLFRDCIDRLYRKFGVKWHTMPRKNESGKFTKLGKEVDAVQNLLWHATEANWFEYHAGSKVYYFRFPLRYQTIAQDGVPIYFEKLGPDTMKPQPAFDNQEVKDRVRPKIEKVIHRRYVVRAWFERGSVGPIFLVAHHRLLGALTGC
jgi:hypothetical protein